MDISSGKKAKENRLIVCCFGKRVANKKCLPLKSAAAAAAAVPRKRDHVFLLARTYPAGFFARCLQAALRQATVAAAAATAAATSLAGALDEQNGLDLLSREKGKEMENWRERENLSNARRPKAEF